MTLSEMLTDLCKELNNWFDRGQRYFGTFVISNGVLSGFDEKLKPGQYYRVIRSTFNDGVHQYGDGVLTDETFDGAIWPMFVPSNVLRLAGEIAAWRDKYEAMISSPFLSEDFNVEGYSYTKSNTAGGLTWVDFFSGKLSSYRKV